MHYLSWTSSVTLRASSACSGVVVKIAVRYSVCHRLTGCQTRGRY